MKSSALSAARARSKGSTIPCSRPRRRTNETRSSRVVIWAGQLAGSSTQRGWGSKVIQAAVAPWARATSTTFRSTAWCPRCTPSKLPMARTTRARRSSGRPKWTLIPAPSSTPRCPWTWSAQHLVRDEGPAQGVGVAERDQTSLFVVRPQEPRSGLGQHPNRAAASDRGLLLVGETDALHVGRQHHLRRQQRGLDRGRVAEVVQPVSVLQPQV